MQGVAIRTHMTYLVIWLLLCSCYQNKGESDLKQSDVDSFAERMAKKKSKNPDDRHKIHKTFLMKHFLLVINLKQFGKSSPRKALPKQESLPGKSICLRRQRRPTPRFGYGDVVFDLFIETRFLHLITLLSNFSKLL